MQNYYICRIIAFAELLHLQNYCICRIIAFAELLHLQNYCICRIIAFAILEVIEMTIQIEHGEITIEFDTLDCMAVKIMDRFQKIINDWSVIDLSDSTCDRLLLEIETDDEVLRFIKGLRKPRQNPVTRKQIESHLRRFPMFKDIDSEESIVRLIHSDKIAGGALSLRCPQNKCTTELMDSLQLFEPVQKFHYSIFELVDYNDLPIIFPSSE